MANQFEIKILGCIIRHSGLPSSGRDESTAADADRWHEPPAQRPPTRPPQHARFVELTMPLSRLEIYRNDARDSNLEVLSEVR